MVSATDLLAVDLQHAIRDSDTADSRQTNNLCHTLERRPVRLICAGTSHLDRPSGRLGLDALAHMNDRGLTISQRIFNKDVDKGFLNGLFAEDSFQAVSGYIAVHADFDQTKLSFAPAHVIGAFKLINPSLPEIHATAAMQSVLRLSHNFYFPKLGLYDALVTVEPYFFERTLKNIDIDILEMSTIEDPKPLIKSSKIQGVDGDVTLGFLAQKPWLPNVHTTLRNIMTQEILCEPCEESFIDIRPYFQTSAVASLSFTIPHSFGASMIGGSLPFAGAYRERDLLNAGGSYAFVLRSFKLYTFASPLKRGAGFKFATDLYDLSIQYTDEKQDNQLQIEREQHVYLFTEFAI